MLSDHEEAAHMGGGFDYDSDSMDRGSGEYQPAGQHHVVSDADFLLGIHRLAGVLVGELALKIELDQVWLRINDPMILEPRRAERDVLLPGSQEAVEHMHELLIESFADRVHLLPGSKPDELTLATHALESTVSETRSGVEIRFRLLSLESGAIVARARKTIPNVDLSLLSDDPDEEQHVGRRRH